MAWQPSQLREFDEGEQTGEASYVPWSAQEEVIPADVALAQVNMGVGLTYGYG
jgi:hypothetical protein